MTADGSGFNDELAALFFPMQGQDAWAVDWASFRAAAAAQQLSSFSETAYEQIHAFGLSASEVPEPWEQETVAYGAWGMGGLHASLNDGSTFDKPPIVAPHYAALLAAEHPRAFEAFYLQLMGRGLLSLLNSVESMRVKANGEIPFNSRKLSWNLSLQALGNARALTKCSGQPYPPYFAFAATPLWSTGYAELMP